MAAYIIRFQLAPKFTFYQFLIVGSYAALVQASLAGAKPESKCTGLYQLILGILPDLKKDRPRLSLMTVKKNTKKRFHCPFLMSAMIILGFFLVD